MVVYKINDKIQTDIKSNYNNACSKLIGTSILGADYHNDLNPNSSVLAQK